MQATTISTWHCTPMPRPRRPAGSRPGSTSTTIPPAPRLCGWPISWQITSAPFTPSRKKSGLWPPPHWWRYELPAPRPSWQSWATTITPRTPSGLRTILQTIARALATGVCEYFGLPLLSPGEVRNAVVSTDGSNLNLRGGPSTTAPVLQKVPDHASVEVLGESGGWYVIRYDGLVGYVLGNYLLFL